MEAMARLRLLCLLSAVVSVLASSALRAETPAPLQAAIGNWSAGKDDWALTQRVRTLSDDGRVTEERLERYDPSLPDIQRWHLLEVDGHEPTEAQRQSLERRKNLKPHKRGNKPLEDFLDLPQAVATSETARAVVYTIGVRPGVIPLTQTEKLVLLVTVGRESHAIERVTAVLHDSMRVALGLARITGVDFDLSFDPALAPDEPAAEDNPASGTARVSMSKFGVRMEYEWSDFRRVTGYAAPAK